MIGDLYRQRDGVDVKKIAEADVCGALPSGEKCSLEPDHDGAHRKMVIATAPTDYQEPRATARPACESCGAAAASAVPGPLHVWWSCADCFVRGL